MNKKIVVGMSGGVDSSVAAYLLKAKGYDVIGVTMQIWQDETHEQIENNGGCCGLSAVEDARKVANKLGIPYYVMNFKNEFKHKVIDYFLEEYQQGRTPNPCIACNRYVKWESLLRKSLEIGAEYIATGHYAKVVKDDKINRYLLKTSETTAKDQTYALYNLTQYQLQHTLMPVGDYNKDEIRQIASDIGLDVANKPDSQEICFVNDNDYASFIEKNTGKKLNGGDFVDKNGNFLGKHKGIVHYTIGQRKGLGISFGKPMFVIKIDTETNQIVLGDNEDLFQNALYADNLNFIMFEKLEGTKKLNAKIRYSHKPSPCTISMKGNILECVFEQPQRAITPGQAVVFYEDEYVVGGGTIINGFNKEE